MITGVFPPRRGGPLAAHGNAVGLIRYKTLSPEGASHDEATLSDGPDMLECPFREYFFWGRFSHGVAMGSRRSAPCGASDLAKAWAGFLNKAERLIHGVPIANNPENSDSWYDSTLAEGAEWVVLTLQ
jgi:hypothetical protein